MRKILIVILVSLIFTGCSSIVEIDKLSAIEPADSNTASQVSYTTALSKGDREQLIYQQVADRTLVDISALDAINEEDGIALKNYMKDVCDKIEGVRNNNVLKDEFVNYILFEMEKTPYRWYREDIKILGVDSSSRSYIVDVTFRTKDTDSKFVKTDSTIPIGSENYSDKTRVRLTRYINILDNKLKGYNEDWLAELEEFERVYGSVEDILDSQASYTLAEKARQGEFITYGGLVDSEEEKINASMTVRFVFSNEYILGVNMGLSCKHMYITEYHIDQDPLSNLKLVDLKDYDALLSEMDTLIYSYNRAVDGDNFEGLNKLVQNFGKIDKHYKDMFTTSFRKINGYAISIYEVNEKRIKAGVVRIRKIRAKGSDMSYPVYEEKWMYEIELIEDELKIVNDVLIKSTLIGEPSIVNEGIEGTKGFVAAVNLSETDKKYISEAVNNFNQVQINYDIVSDNFIKVVDMGLQAEDLQVLRDNMVSVNNVFKKVTWIKSYNSAYTNYVNLTLLEVFYKEDGTAVECESDISLVYSGNSGWKIMDYRLLKSSEISPNTVSTESAFSIVERTIPDKKDTEVGSEDEEHNEEEDSEEGTRLPSILDMFGN